MAWHFLILFLAVVFDRFIGEPAFIWKRVPHPIVIFGNVISYLDRELNRPEWSDKERFWAGWSAIFLLIVIVAFIGFFIHIICFELGLLGVLIEALIASIFFAQKSLVEHVSAVFQAFLYEGLEGARKAVSMIVGRDPKKLDEIGITSAAIETLAENSSDGVVAPVFWFFLFGLPGLFAYKMLNTADSMIGYRNERYFYFGNGAAKLDDIANYIPARLTALLTLVTVWMIQGIDAAKHCCKIIRRDARYHRSPNAGWPESAYAATLNIRLVGPRIYDGKSVEEPYLNIEGNLPIPSDIPCAVKLFNQIMNVMTVICALVFIMFFIADSIFYVVGFE